MLTGILAGLAAGAMWGLSFVAPLLVAPYSAFDLTVGRYLVFGLSSAAILAFGNRGALGALTRADLWVGLWLGLLGYVLYYLFVAFAVLLAGPALPALVVGSLPILLAIYANWRERAVPWRVLTMPLVAVAAGLALVNADAFEGSTAPGAWQPVAAGLALAAAGTLVWMWYAIVNAGALLARPGMGAVVWSALTGLGAGAGIVLAAPAGFALGLSNIPALGLDGAAALPLLFWSVATGLLSSWVATYLWSIASRRLSMALSAQLIVSETLFALLYGFLLAERWPGAFELAGSALLLAGVMLGTYGFHKVRG
jgi:drug/metabolite transporter (DMT)-like permease